MVRTELERRLEAAEKQMLGLQDEIENMKAKLAEMQDEQEIPEFPIFKGSEAYFFCDAKLDVRRTAFPASRTNHVSMDFNAFRTSEYAQEFANKCKLIAMLLHCKWHIDRNFVPDWNNCDDKFTVWYNHVDNEWVIDIQEVHEMPSVYFSTAEAAQKAAEWLNKHWKEYGNG